MWRPQDSPDNGHNVAPNATKHPLRVSTNMTLPTTPHTESQAHTAQAHAVPLPVSPDDVKAQFNDAVVLHQSGQLTAAQSAYEAILAVDPAHAESLHFLGVIAIQSGDPVGALDWIGKAIAINPGNAFFHMNHGNVLRQAGQMDAALDSFDRAIAIKPDFTDAHALRGAVLHDLLQLEAAIASFDRVLALRPHDQVVCFNRGNALRALGQWEAAVASFDQAIALEPLFAEAFVNRGLTQHDLKQAEAALASFDRAIALRPDFAEAYLNRGLTLQALLSTEAALEDAIRMFDKACQLLPDAPEQHLCHAKALAKAQRFAEAQVAAQRALAVDSNDSSGARMFLAALGAIPMPDKIPDALLHKLYDAKAAVWDTGANAHYQGAELVGRALLAQQRSTAMDVLDAGCGTGLVGVLVRGMARRLDGVDMSAPMLERAREKDVYDTLVCGDMIALLQQNPQQYDAVVSAATLVHFASLQSIFEATAVALRPGGLFIFTVFPNEKDPAGIAVDHLDGMAQGGIYVHGRDYLMDLAVQSGFAVASMVSAIHEYEASGQPKMCLVVTLVRSARV